MNREDLAFLSLCEQAKLLRRREVSPVELMETYLERIDRYNDRLRAFITVCGEQALARAREAEQEIAAGRFRGPLHGIPLGVKDQILTNGVPTTGGSRVLAGWVPQEDATVVARLKAAGAILVGKQNLDELGLGGTVEYPYGRPRNPRNADYSATGSSGGSAVATVAALSSASIGEDGGGSIRRPASFNGCVGLRPSQGRISRHGILAWNFAVDTVGPLTRTVEDCALLTELIAGQDPRDVITTSHPVPRYVALLDGTVQGMRLGVLRQFTESGAIDEEVKRSVDGALRVLESLGATLVDVSIPRARLVAPIGMLANEGLGPPLLRWAQTKPDLLDYGARTRIITNALVPSSLRQTAQRARSLLRREVLEAMRGLDALVYPTHPTPPPRAGAESHRFTSVTEVKERMFGRRAHTLLSPVVGAPALSVPCGFSEQGLPIGLEVLAWPFREDTAFRIAHAYQQATSWHRRRPPLG